MITGEPGIDEERFLVLGAWNVVTRELLTREELEQRGISYDSLPQIFPALEVPIFVPPPPPQGPQPGSPPHADPVNGEPNAEDSGASDAVHIIVDIPDSPEFIVISSDDDEEEPEEEIEPEEDEGNQAFVAQLEEELQEEGYEEEPQGAVQEPST